MDLVFVLDGSSSVRPTRQFPRLITFVKAVVARLDVSSEATRVGAMLFDNEPRIQFHLNECFNTTLVNNKIMDITLGPDSSREGTRTGGIHLFKFFFFSFQEEAFTSQNILVTVCSY